jgi:hypothetical protein
MSQLGESWAWELRGPSAQRATLAANVSLAPECRNSGILQRTVRRRESMDETGDSVIERHDEAYELDERLTVLGRRLAHGDAAPAFRLACFDPEAEQMREVSLPIQQAAYAC